MVVAVAAFDELHEMDEVQAAAASTMQSRSWTTRNILQRLNRNSSTV